jgi:hypothetical protein
MRPRARRSRLRPSVRRESICVTALRAVCARAAASAARVFSTSARAFSTAACWFSTEACEAAT